MEHQTHKGDGIKIVEKGAANIAEFRENIFRFEEFLKKIPGAMIGDNEVHPLKHHFAEGCYIREVTSIADQLVVSKIHRYDHPFFLLKGELSILSENGVAKIKAPFWGITKAGTKRVLYTHSDIWFITVHVTRETDLTKIEDEIICKNFKEIDVPLSDGRSEGKGGKT